MLAVYTEATMVVFCHVGFGRDAALCGECRRRDAAMNAVHGL